MAAPSYSGITLFNNFTTTNGTPSANVPSGVTLASNRFATSEGAQLAETSVQTLVGGTSITFGTALNVSAAEDFVIYVYRWLTRPFTQSIGNLASNTGLRIALLNDTSNYRVYIVDGGDATYGATNHTGKVPVIIEVNASSNPNSNISTVGTFSSNAIDSFGLWWPQNNTSYTSFTIDSIYYGKHLIMTAGEVGNSITFSGAVTYFQGLVSNVPYLASLESGYSAIKYFGLPLQIGNGSTPSYFVDATPETIQFQRLTKTALFSSTYKQCNTIANDNFFGLRFLLSSSDNVRLSFKTFQADTTDKFKFVVDSGSSTSATLILTSCVAIRAGIVTLRSPFVANSSIFTRCGTVTLNDCTLNNTSILSGIDSVAVVGSTTATINNCVIDGATNALQITSQGDYSNLQFAITNSTTGVSITTGVTNGQEIDLSALTFSGNTTDIYWAGTTGSITVTVNQTGLTTSTAGGTINLVTPIQTHIRGVSGVPVGSAVSIFKRSRSKFADRFQYTLASGNNSGNNTVVINQSIPLDTPTSGFIRLYDQAANIEQRYQYLSWIGSTFTLSGTLSRSFPTNSGAYVGYIDVLGTVDDEISVTLPYVANRDVVLCCRLGSGSNAIQEIRQDFTITNSDVTVPVSPIDDAINNL